RHARDAGAPAVGRRPRARVRRRRGDRGAVPLQRLLARQRAGMRRPRGARRRDAAARPLGELRQAAARARRAGGATERAPAQAAGPGVQDSRTGESTQETLTGPRLREDAVVFALPDPGRRLTEVVLAQDVRRPRLGPPFARHGDVWALEFPRPDADRMEYLLQVDGELVPDPANPLRAPGPFGDKSAVEWPEYRPPAWLDTIADHGRVTQ